MGKKTKERAESGLSKQNILNPKRVQRTITIDSDDEIQPEPVRHKYGTRTAQHGRAADTYEKYDMKHHPADWELRPKQAAKRRSGSASVRRSMSASTTPGKAERDEDDTDAESLPTLAGDEESDQDTDQDKDEESEDENIVVERKPDVKAFRVSKRPQAQRYVNYSTKHHKDDHRIPGFQHKARQLKRSAAEHQNGGDTKKKRKTAKPRNAPSSHGSSESEASLNVDILVEETLTQLHTFPPPAAYHPEESVARAGPEAAENNDVASDDPGVEADGRPLNDMTLPEFAAFQDSTHEDHMPSGAPLPSETTDAVDDALLAFTQFESPEIDAADNVTTVPPLTFPVHDLAREAVEVSVDGPIENENDSVNQTAPTAFTSHVHVLVNEAEEATNDESIGNGSADSFGLGVKEANSGNSPPAVPPRMNDSTLEASPDKMGTSFQSAATSSETLRSSSHSAPEVIQAGKDLGAGMQDLQAVAKTHYDEVTQTPSQEIDAREKRPSSDSNDESKPNTNEAPRVEATSEVSNVTDIQHEQGPGDAREVLRDQNIEQPSPADEQDHSSELIASGAATLQAILEQNIAASQSAVASSSPGMLI